MEESRDVKIIWPWEEEGSPPKPEGHQYTQEDAELFFVWFQKTKDHYVSSRVEDSDDAKDIWQEFWQKVNKARQTVLDRNNTVSYASGMLFKHVMDYFRDKKKRGIVRYDEGKHDDESSDFQYDPAKRYTDLGLAALERVKKCLDSLTPVDEVLYEAVVGKMSDDELVKRLEQVGKKVTDSNARQMKSRFKKRIRKACKLHNLNYNDLWR